MAQAKISSFFQSSFPKTQHSVQFQKDLGDGDLSSGMMDANFPLALAFEDTGLDPKSDCDDLPLLQHDCKYKTNGSSSNSSGRNINRKRRYEQYHLDLGQSDFNLHTCSICGLMYTRGVENDELAHRKFHQDYDRGIQMKGWHNERVVAGPWSNGDRILLILDSDPPVQKRMVQKVLNVTKTELGFADDHIIHPHCKVYLFISGHRICGWLVTEPIQTAHRVIPSSLSNSFVKENTEATSKVEMNITNSKKSKEATLKFGDFKFHRELIKKDCPTTRTKLNKWDDGAIMCEEDTAPANCGIKAVWVVPSCRRKGIATKLMDVARRSFCKGQILEIAECAFSPPTSAGLAFASAYTNSGSFLVYRGDDV